MKGSACTRRAAALCVLVLLLLPGVGPARELPLPEGWLAEPASNGLTVHFRTSDATLAAGLSRSGPAVRRRIAGILGVDPGRPVDVVLIPAAADEAETGLPSAPEWASGFTVAGSDVLFIRVRSLGVYPDRDVTSVFAHELAHAELARLAGPRGLPRWFEEGTCMVLARPWDLRDSLSLSLAMLFHDAGGLTGYEAGFPEEAAAARAAYAQAFSFVSWLAEHGGGATALARVARRVGEGRSFGAAFTLEFGLTPDQALAAWRRSVGRWYRIVSVITGTTTFWGVMALFFLTVVIRKRRRTREILERWQAEEGDDLPEGPIQPR